jgi:hypothetical protein
MAVTLTNTGITFSDGSTQTTKAEAAGPGVNVFDSGGTYTVPSGVNYVQIEAVGGAGGSGSRSYYGNAHGTGGSGGGISTIKSVTPGSTLTVSVGAGGNNHAGGSHGTVYSGNAGGASTINGTGVAVAANGGNGGYTVYGPPGTPGTGGNASGGGNVTTSFPGKGGSYQSRESNTTYGNTESVGGVEVSGLHANYGKKGGYNSTPTGGLVVIKPSDLT